MPPRFPRATVWRATERRLNVRTAGTVSSEAAADRADAHGWRLVTAKVLVVVVSVLAVLSVVAGYVRYQALDTPTVRSAAGGVVAGPGGPAGGGGAPGGPLLPECDR